MHEVIWCWIRDWCDETCMKPETREQHCFSRWPLLPLTPADVLQDLIEKIDISEDSLHPFVIDGGEQNLLGDFSQKVCSLGNYLYETSQQDKMSWHIMKVILEFYLTDCIRYINKINSLELTAYQQNEMFELGIDWEKDRETMTIDKLRNIVIWSRYITGTRIWTWRRGVFESILLARGEEFWSSEISNYIEILESQPVEDTHEVERQLTENQKKQNEALKKIQEIVDDVKEEIEDGLYLQLMNLMNNNYYRGE